MGWRNREGKQGGEQGRETGEGKGGNEREGMGEEKGMGREWGENREGKGRVRERNRAG